jgi:F-type H+-transporting ATPase subunit b
MEVLEKLGIDWKLLAAQVVNFALLFFILRRYAYRPILTFLDERKDKIDRGLRDAEEAAKRLQSAVAEKEAVLTAARADARGLVEIAEKAAKERDAKRLAETEDRVRRLLAEGEQRSQEERGRLLDEAKQELADTVVQAVEKILREKMATGADQTLVRSILEEKK